jgi:hypothetical protein
MHRMKSDSGDGCAPAICPVHGFLLRVIVGAEVFCQGCGRWYRAVASEKLRGRRDVERDRKREQRTKDRLAA